MYRLVARTRVKEAMTASALLTVVGVTLVMQLAGLPASLGAFIAGVLLADSDYRHEIVADIAPFEGLLLGLFFTAIGMSLNLGLILAEPQPRARHRRRAAGASRASCSSSWDSGWASKRARRAGWRSLSRRAASSPSCCSPPAPGPTSWNSRSPTCFRSPSRSPWRRRRFCWRSTSCFAPKPAPARAFDELPPKNGHVVIAGFGRVGQIVARVLSAKRIPVTALDANPEQVDFVRKFGAQIYYGDASRPEMLEAAQTGKARAFVLAIDDVEASLRTARMVRRNYPHVPIYARARDRRHIHRLMDEGIRIMRRETFLASLDLTREVLRGLGLPEREVRHTVDTFQIMDRKRLYEDYKHYTDLEKLQAARQEPRPGARGAVRQGCGGSGARGRHPEDALRRRDLTAGTRDNGREAHDDATTDREGAALLGFGILAALWCAPGSRPRRHGAQGSGARQGRAQKPGEGREAAPRPSRSRAQEGGAAAQSVDEQLAEHLTPAQQQTYLAYRTARGAYERSIAPTGARWKPSAAGARRSACSASRSRRTTTSRPTRPSIRARSCRPTSPRSWPR